MLLWPAHIDAYTTMGMKHIEMKKHTYEASWVLLTKYSSG